MDQDIRRLSRASAAPFEAESGSLEPIHLLQESETPSWGWEPHDGERLGHLTSTSSFAIGGLDDRDSPGDLDALFRGEGFSPVTRTRDRWTPIRRGPRAITACADRVVFGLPFGLPLRRKPANSADPAVSGGMEIPAQEVFGGLEASRWTPWRP